MKRILTALMCLVAAFAFVRAAEPQRYLLDLKDFGEIKVTDGINVEWRCSADSAGLVTFTTTPEMVTNIILSNNKNCLRVQLADTDWPLHHLPTLTVYSNFLGKAENSGDSTLVLQTPPPTAELKMRVVGNGTIIARGVHATTVDAKIDTGNGRIVLQGTAQWVKLRSLGSGTIEAGELHAENGSLQLAGTGSIDCWVTNELTVKGLGSGKVYCKGDPKIKNRTLGTVDVIKVE